MGCALIISLKGMRGPFHYLVYFLGLLMHFLILKLEKRRLYLKILGATRCIEERGTFRFHFFYAFRSVYVLERYGESEILPEKEKRNFLGSLIPIIL